MNSLLLNIGIIVLLEALGTGVFALLVRWTQKKVDPSLKRQTLTFGGVVKGWVERAFLVFALIKGYPQALTLFAALKIATRIKDEHQVSNDFYLIGNLISVALAMVYSELLLDYFN